MPPLAPAPRTSVPRTVSRIGLGAALVFAGVTHLTVAREEFQAQVPPWLPFDADTVVVLSGIVEISLGGALIALGRWRIPIGWMVAAFFVAVFPGNIAQYVEHRDAFGLDTDAKRLARLPFQLGLIAASLWSTAAWRDRARLR
jgi:uncharacterized membrane protein